MRINPPAPNDPDLSTLGTKAITQSNSVCASEGPARMRHIALLGRIHSVRCESNLVTLARVVHCHRLLLAEAHRLFHRNRKLALKLL